MKRVEANDDGAMVMLASCYHVGCEDLQQDRAKAMELFVRAAEMVSSMAHFTLGSIYREGGFEEGQEFTILPANQCDEKHIIHFLCWRVKQMELKAEKERERERPLYANDNIVKHI